jgi:hypothetical protein
MSSKKSTPPQTKKVARDAGTGQFVTKNYAQTHKKTTVVETVRIDPPRKDK